MSFSDSFSSASVGGGEAAPELVPAIDLEGGMITSTMSSESETFSRLVRNGFQELRVHTGGFRSRLLLSLGSSLWW